MVRGTTRRAATAGRGPRIDAVDGRSLDPLPSLLRVLAEQGLRFRYVEVPQPQRHGADVECSRPRQARLSHRSECDGPASRSHRRARSLAGTRPADPRDRTAAGTAQTAAKTLLLRHACSRLYHPNRALPDGTESPLAPNLGHPPQSIHGGAVRDGGDEPEPVRHHPRGPLRCRPVEVQMPQ